MPAQIAYWILMLLFLILSLWWGWRTPAGQRFPLLVDSLIPFLLFLLIGLRLFGPILQ